MLEQLQNVASHGWLVFCQMSPYLLMGFSVAGILSVFMPRRFVVRHLGRPGLASIFKAAALGVPLPLCSCSVLPVAGSIRRQGATRSATASFLLATPETGVDSIAVTYSLLGPIFAIIRPITALCMGVTGGLGVHAVSASQADEEETGTDQDSSCEEAAESCCASKPTEEEEADSCCEQEESKSGFRTAVLGALHHGFVVLPRDLARPLLIGVVVAGAITALVPSGSLSDYLGGGILSILLAMAIATPLYICATGSVPIALGLIYAGASPGAALALLVAGPATNAATIAVVWKMLGRRSALVYLAVVMVAAISVGLVVNALAGPDFRESLPLMTGHEGHGPEAPPWIWGVILLTVFLVSCKPLAGWFQRKDDQTPPDDEDDTSSKVKYAGPCCCSQRK